MNTAQILGVLGAILLIYFFTNSWRHSKDISSFVKEFGVKKIRGLRFSVCGCCLRRKNKAPIWNAFGQIATDEKGIYYSSVCLPFFFVPWEKLSFSEFNDLKGYSHLKIEGYPDFVWLVPDRFNLLING